MRWFCAETCVYGVVHVRAHMRKPENNISYYFSDSIHLCLETTVFHWSGDYSKGCAELQRSAHILCSPIPALELTGYTSTHSFVCFKTWVLRSNFDFHARRAIPLLAEPSAQSFGFITVHALFFLVKIALSSLVYFSSETYVCLIVCVCVLMCFR